MYHMQLANFACTYCLSNPCIIRIEASVETNLQFDPSLLNRCQCTIDPLEIEVNRLLAKNMLTGCCRFRNDLRVCIGSRANRNRVNAFVCQNLFIIGSRFRDVQPLG